MLNPEDQNLDYSDSIETFNQDEGHNRHIQLEIEKEESTLFDSFPYGSATSATQDGANEHSYGSDSHSPFHSDNSWRRRELLQSNTFNAPLNRQTGDYNYFRLNKQGTEDAQAFDSWPAQSQSNLSEMFVEPSTGGFVGSRRTSLNPATKSSEAFESTLIRGNFHENWPAGELRMRKQAALSSERSSPRTGIRIDSFSRKISRSGKSFIS